MAKQKTPEQLREPPEIPSSSFPVPPVVLSFPPKEPDRQTLSRSSGHFAVFICSPAGGQHALPGPHPSAEFALPGPNDPPSRIVAATERMPAATPAATSPRPESEERRGQ